MYDHHTLHKMMQYLRLHFTNIVNTYLLVIILYYNKIRKIEVYSLFFRAVHWTYTFHLGIFANCLHRYINLYTMEQQ